MPHVLVDAAQSGAKAQHDDCLHDSDCCQHCPHGSEATGDVTHETHRHRPDRGDAGGGDEGHARQAAARPSNRAEAPAGDRSLMRPFSENC